MSEKGGRGSFIIEMGKKKRMKCISPAKSYLLENASYWNEREKKGG